MRSGARRSKSLWRTRLTRPRCCCGSTRGIHVGRRRTSRPTGVTVILSSRLPFDRCHCPPRIRRGRHPPRGMRGRVPCRRPCCFRRAPPRAAAAAHRRRPGRRSGGLSAFPCRRSPRGSFPSLWCARLGPSSVECSGWRRGPWGRGGWLCGRARSFSTTRTPVAGSFRPRTAGTPRGACAERDAASLVAQRQRRFAASPVVQRQWWFPTRLRRPRAATAFAPCMAVQPTSAS
mmetsp:Transcript_102561/g.295320  ORF Transcript_102561/g.295320 Transcript_102561/m.295320 type:complete len:232 (-) Transcript_102561:75-770(-)